MAFIGAAMNKAVLKFITNNAREKLIFIAKSKNLNPTICFSTLDKIIENEFDLQFLTDEQHFYLTNFIEPLVENGFCEGVWHYLATHYKCNGDVYIDEGYLSQCYMDIDFRCHTCSYDEIS